MLTRDQIDGFVTLAPYLSRFRIDQVPSYFVDFGLVEADENGRAAMAPNGHDLQATAYYLPAPEPEPVPPSCPRCGGETEVPVFMGPLMMPCPACSNDDGSPKRLAEPARRFTERAQDLTPALHSVADFAEFGQAALERLAELCTPISRMAPLTDPMVVRDASVTIDTRPGDVIAVALPDRPAGDGWVHIDSDDAAAPFVGKRVQVHAPRSPVGMDSHELHWCVALLSMAGEGWLQFGHHDGVSAFARGNVYLRLVAE